MTKILALLKLVLLVMKRAIRLPYSFLFFLFSPFLYLLHYHSRTGNGLFRLICLALGSLTLAWVVSEMHTCKYIISSIEQEWDVQQDLKEPGISERNFNTYFVIPQRTTSWES